MSTYGVCLTDGGNLVAETDLSAAQFHAVAISDVRAVALATTAGMPITGILMNNPTAGLPAEVAFDGFTKAACGSGGVTAGQQLMVEASTGKLVQWTSGNTIVAVAIETAAAGTIGLVRIVPSAG